MAMQGRQVPVLREFCSNGENKVHTRNIDYQTALCNYAMQCSVLSLLLRCEGNRQCKGRNLRLAGCSVSGLFLPLLFCSVVVYSCADFEVFQLKTSMILGV